MIDPATATVLGFGIGDLLSMFLFLADQRHSRKGTHEIIKSIEDDHTIRDYLEWLRRQDQKALIKKIADSEKQLLQEIGSHGAEIYGLTSAILQAVQTSHQDLVIRLRALNDRFPVPVLATVPLRVRPLTTVPLLGRDEELGWLRSKTGDVVVFGQPGSGKTYLLFHYARECGGRFLLTKNEDVAAKAILSMRPPLVIVDDAADKKDMIQRLVHLRGEMGLSYRLVAICWPFEWEQVLANMMLPRSAALELSLLNRNTIAEIIQSVIKDAGYQAPNDIVREINNQAVGRPGLAVALTQASLKEDLQAVMRGETLAQKMSSLFNSIVGGRAAHIMAAFSVGGKAGMEMEAVSRAMNIPILELHQALREMAPGGVLDPLSGTRLMVIPGALRRAIIKDVFFKPGGVCLPQSFYEALLNSAPDRDEAVHTLLESVHVGAVVDHSWLQSLVAICGSAKVWDAYAWMGPDQCRHIIENHPEMIAHIIEPALHYTPSLIIPRMLESAVIDNRPLNSHPEAPLRKLADWVSHAKVETPDVVQRRRDLLAAIKAWLDGGGDHHTAFRALAPCFSLGYEMTDTDPGEGMKVTFSSGLLSLSDVDVIAALWPEFLEIVRTHGVPDWKPLTSIISEWLSPRNRFGKSGGADYLGKTLPVARRMIVDLVPLSNGHNGFLRWAYMHAVEAELDPGLIPVNQEYLQLYPVERLSADWKAEEEKNARNAEALVDSWKSLTFLDIISRLQRYESEAASMGHSWPRLSTYVCRLIAGRRDVQASDVLSLIKSGVPADLIDPFLVSAFERGVSMDAALRNCISRNGYRHLVIYHTLMGRTPHIYPEISQLLSEYTEYMESLVYHGKIPEKIMQLLLTHEDKYVRLSAALVEFRFDPKGQVRDSVKTAWRAAVVEGLTEYERARDLRHIHDLDKIVAYDRTLAFAILMAMAIKGGFSMAMWDMTPIAPLSVLNREERLNLLDTCKDLFITEIPKVLIGDDINLYRQFLARAEMKRHHLTPLVGLPTDAGWIDKALVALDAGYAPMDVALAVRGKYWGGFGPMSKMWQEWIDKFKPLLDHANPKVQAIGRAGVEWSKVQHSRALKDEKHEDIYGRFDE